MITSIANLRQPASILLQVQQPCCAVETDIVAELFIKCAQSMKWAGFVRDNRRGVVATLVMLWAPKGIWD
jgi:hypothetical protein